MKRIRPAGAPPFIPIAFAAERELRERLRAIAYREDRTVSTIVRELVITGLAQRERQPETTPAA